MPAALPDEEVNYERSRGEEGDIGARREKGDERREGSRERTNQYH